MTYMDFRSIVMTSSKFGDRGTFSLNLNHLIHDFFTFDDVIATKPEVIQYQKTKSVVTCKTVVTISD